MHPRLAGVARAQGGVFTRRQAFTCGYSPERIHTELKNGRWFRVVTGVYRLAGAPGGWSTRVWAALLAAGPGAVLGGRAAGRVHRIDGVPGYDRLDVVVPAGRRPRRSTGARVEAATLVRADVIRRSGIPVLSGARTVVDLARREQPETAVRIAADALRTGTATPSRISDQLDRARGRDGIAQARAVVAMADPLLESVLEAELLELIRGVRLVEGGLVAAGGAGGLVAAGGAGGSVVVPQFEVVQAGHFVARLDFAIEELKLGIEADGYGVHALRPAFERDRERNALLQLAGWANLSFTAAQIRSRPGWVQEVIAEMVSIRRAALLGDPHWAVGRESC